MRFDIIFFSFVVTCFACNQESIRPSSDLLLLKVDYLSYELEEGLELSYPWSASYTLNWEYQMPNDFGHVRFYFEEVNEEVFQGSVVWLGEGERTFPSSMKDADAFDIVDTDLSPSIPDIRFINYNKGILSDYEIELAEEDLWVAIYNRAIVQDYLDDNNVIEVFLYTPSVGGCCQEEWGWYLILHQQNGT